MCLDQSVCCLLLPLCACITHRKLFYGVANMIQHCSSRTSRSSFCDSYERCFYMCVRVHVCGRAILNEGRFQPTLPLISKAPAQHGSGTTAWASSSSSSGTTPANLARLIHTSRNDCVSPFQLATPPGIQADHIPKRDILFCINRRFRSEPASKTRGCHAMEAKTRPIRFICRKFDISYFNISPSKLSIRYYNRYSTLVLLNSFWKEARGSCFLIDGKLGA